MRDEFVIIILLISAMLISGCVSEQGINQTASQATNQTANQTINQTGDITILTGTTINPELECKMYWWFDDTTRVCGQRQFCGAFMYLGLRTFDTKEACEAELNAETDPYYNLQADNQLLEDTLASNTLYNVKFLYKFPIAKSPMLYYIYNDTPIDAIAYETTMKQIPFAFAAWERAVYYSKLKFVQTNTTPESGIIIKIVDNHADEKLTYNDLVDAQANTEIFTNYTLITGGTMTTEAYKGAYAARTVAEHGIGHILGFDNCGTKVSIMYETFLTGEVQQKITNDLIAALNVLYKNVPASD